jgi:FMN phosphatase YigB (HAD superfamily)
MTRNPTAVLFDACSTLLEVDTLRFEHRLARDGWPVFGLHAAVWEVTTGTAHDATAAGVHTGGPTWLPALGETLGVPVEALVAAWESEDGRANLWGRAIEGALPCLTALLRRGYRVGVVSNADGRIRDALALAGLADALEVIVDSAVVGVSKPDPGIFVHALDELELEAGEVWYVGDSAIFDVPSARDAGLTPVLIDHAGRLQVDATPKVASFGELLQVLGSRGSLVQRRAT